MASSHLEPGDLSQGQGDPRAVANTAELVHLRQEVAQTTATLREQEAFLQSIYNGLDQAIFVVDVLENGTFRYVGINPAHERLTGLRSEDLEGQSPEIVLPAEIATTVIERYQTCVRQQTSLSYEECLSLRGEETWWLTTLQPLTDDRGEIYRLIGTSINITRRKQAEAHAQQLNADLEQRVAERTHELTRLNAVLLQTAALLERRNQELDQFVYVASHDLKAPLRAIANLSAWLEEDLGQQLPEENKEHLHLLRGRAHRMEALINALLEYSRVGRKDFPMELVNLQELVAEVIDSLDPLGFTVDIAADLPTFTAKRLLLQQVFANLLSNGVKYCDRSDGRLQVTWIDLGDAYRFSIADNGPGIAPRYHQKIFEVFQTLQARDQFESTGIGLAIVKKILDTEGGTIMVESDGQSGTTFHVTWPKILAECG